MEEEKREFIEIEKVDETENENQQDTKIVEDAKKDKKGFCIASMVLGIVALVLFCLWYISIPCAILAIIFGVLGIKSTKKGMAIAGLVTGSVGLVISFAIIVFIVIFGMALGIYDAIDDDYSTYRNYRNYDWYDYD